MTDRQTNLMCRKSSVYASEKNREGENIELLMTLVPKGLITFTYLLGQQFFIEFIGDFY